MNYNDEEVQLITAWNDARKAYVAAKKGKAKDPEAYIEAKAAMTALRFEWRTVRETFYEPPAQGDASAAPLTLSAPATPQEIAEAQKAGS